MRRLFSSVLVLLLLISIISRAFPAHAQTEPNNEQEVVVSKERISDNQTTRQILAVNTELMEELARLMKMLEEAEFKGDKELIIAWQEKIQVIKEKIRQVSEKPTATGESGKPQLVIEKPTVVANSEGPVVSSTYIDKCAELEALEKKRKHYEALYVLTDDELKDRGYRGGKEDIRNTIRNLEEAIKRLRIECEAGETNRADGGGDTTTSLAETTPTKAVASRPVAVESGGDITDYYKRRIAEITSEGVEIDKKVASLKELGTEIDRLIEELIKSRTEIRTEEIMGLVTKIEVRPGEIKMDKVSVNTVDKSVVVRIDNRDLKIKQTEANVIIHDGNLEIKALELSIEKEVLRVGDSEVKLLPSAVVEKIKIEPKEIELKEENSKAVYKIKTDESRKLLGFITLKVEKTLTVDAASEEVKIIKEEKPWWAFLTTK